MIRKLCIVLAVSGCIISNCPGYSFAQGEHEKCEWNPVSAGPITTWTAPLCDKGKLVAQPFFFYNRTRGVFDGEGGYKSFTNKETKSQYQEQLFLQYGVTDRFEIDGQGVFQQNLHHVDSGSASSTGFGDTYIFGRYCILHEKHYLPHITALVQLKLPTGKYQKAEEGKLGTDLMGATSGGGSYDVGYGITFTKKMRPFVLHADFIYSCPMLTRVDGVKTKYSDYVNCDLGIECFLPRGFNLMFECNGFIQGDRKADSEFVPASDVQYLNITPGIGWSCDRIQTLLAYQRTIAGTNTDVNDSLIITCVYTF
jgi:hypothetical protein